MRGLILIAGLIAIYVHESAFANCAKTRCAEISMTVASCEAVHIDSSANILPGNVALSLPSAPTVNGVLIVARNRSEKTMACFEGAPLTTLQPRWAKKDNNEFFVRTERDICDEIRNATIVGKTEFPCCDIPPPPPEVLPGTCSVKKRQLTVR